MTHKFILVVKVIAMTAVVAALYWIAINLRFEQPAGYPVIDPPLAIPFQRTITTPVGELVLSYINGQARLEGILQRSTPCVEWEVRIGGTDDLPRSFAEFMVLDKNKGVICIQIIGEPQEILAVSPAFEQTRYRVLFEGEEVFSGAL